MLIAPRANNPIVLSYLALRRAVGAVALAPPFVLAIPWWFLRDHMIESSISAYYYTGMRNLLVGSLCAIAMFMLCCRGYDRKDEIAGILSSIFALGVAFFPTSPDSGATSLQTRVGVVHFTLATLLFLTLAYFCLVLFKMTAADKQLTPQKMKRNIVYTVCGCVILASIGLIVLLTHVFNVPHLIGSVGPVFCFETTSLIAFGVAWLVKGETFLKDQVPDSSGPSRTTVAS
jgi:hypothetical protein